MEKYQMLKAMIFNIQKYSIEDGPGIRTTVFFKGCPLRCKWCHNVESIKPHPQIVWNAVKCIGCGECIKACPQKAIIATKEGLKTDREKCTNCGACAEACPSGARELIGYEITINELIKEVEKDKPFYDNSGGGVTASGGEPTLQSEFIIEFFKKCKERGINVALDTSGFCKWERLNKILEHVDLVLYDMKVFDEKKHVEYTGISNKIILENLQKINAIGKEIWIRVPVIPIFTASEENIQQIGEYIKDFSHITRVDLLPFHKLGVSKYEKLGLDYACKDFEPPPEEEMKKYKKIMEKYNDNVRVNLP
ncbi:MAG: glycyl-radical enzyme activating protein [Candidatus Helarchaeota archaeon]